MSVSWSTSSDKTNCSFVVITKRRDYNMAEDQAKSVSGWHSLRSMSQAFKKRINIHLEKILSNIVAVLRYINALSLMLT